MKQPETEIQPQSREEITITTKTEIKPTLEPALSEIQTKTVSKPTPITPPETKPTKEPTPTTRVEPETIPKVLKPEPSFQKVAKEPLVSTESDTISEQKQIPTTVTKKRTTITQKVKQ